MDPSAAALSAAHKAAKFKLTDETPFDDWAFDARVELRNKGVLSIVLGTDPRPIGSDNSKVVKGWVTRRDLATAVILSRLHSSQIPHVREFEEDPAGMWARLNEIHQATGLGTVTSAWRAFYALRKPIESS
ncbi:hypothetical protein FB45DRAFT_765224, partial [Roridomyces roridus]